ncbi:glycosyltransferase [Microbispora rosea]
MGGGGPRGGPPAGAPPPELLEDRGVLVPPAAPEALADGIARLLDDRALAASMGAAARAWAWKNLDMEAVTEEHLGMYQRLLAARRGR